MDGIGYTDTEGYVSDLIKTIVNKVVEEKGTDYISSVLVTGSFGRGEPTFEITAEGVLMLKSDIEIALVYDKMVDKKRVLDMKERVENQFSEALELMPFQKRRLVKAQNHNYAFVEPKYKTLFTYDVYNGSYTAWGEDYISKRSVKLEEVDIYEAKRIVANRIGELICYHEHGNNVSEDDYRKQWKGKVLLAIVSAWLVCHGLYVSSYHGQYEQIIKARKEVEAYFGTAFIEEYQKVFRFLRENGESYNIKEENLRRYVSDIDRLFKEKNIKRSKVNCLSKVVRSWIKYLKTKSNYGLNFEDGILQDLIDCYVEESPKIYDVSKIWLKVLYY